MDAPSAERTRLLAAAQRRLAATGGTSVSVTDILAEAGLSTRAFYRHFESKDGLLLALFRADADRLAEQIQAAADAAPSPRAALAAWIEQMMRVAADPRRRRRAVLLSSEEVSRARGYAAERTRFAAVQEAGLARVLARGRDDGSFPWADPEPDARWLRAALHQAFDDQMSGLATVGPEAAAGQLADFALRAVGSVT